MPMLRSITVLEKDFEAGWTDADVPIARGARKRLKFSLLTVPSLFLSSLLPLLFLPLFLPPSLTTFRKDKIKCAPITRENLVY